jgi:EAL domain-containing protein (putative c-di-GMP-specific phosphodiesterase class I)
VFEIRTSQLEDPEAVAALAALPGVEVSLSGVESSYDALVLVRKVKPAYVKLERSWVNGLDGDLARQALIGALVTASAAEADGPTVIAEGIETEEELAVLQRLGVKLGQGFLLGRPSQHPVPNGLNGRNRARLSESGLSY